MKLNKRYTISLLYLLSLAIIINIFSYAEDKTNNTWQANTTYKLTVLHTNDHHGHFWQNKNGEYGMSARKTLIDQLRVEVLAAGGSVLLFSGGDINTGVPESDLQYAEPDFKGMNKLGYDAMAVGNHEFDNSLDILLQQQQWVNFPMLSANIYYKATETRLFRPYHIFNQQGIKIAVIGLTTEDTAHLSNLENVAALEFRDPKTEIKQVIAELKATEKPDLIFAITHMGHYENGQHGINAPGDVTLARSLNYGELDMIVGGHSQAAVCMLAPDILNKNYLPGDSCIPDRQNGTYIVQAHEWGKYVGRADYEFKDGELTLINYQLIPVNLKKEVIINDKIELTQSSPEIPEDQEMLEFLRPYQEKYKDQLDIIIAETDGVLMGDRHILRFEQTNLGKLMATSHLKHTQADFAIINSGGIRASINKGVITYKDLLMVQPFKHLLAYIDMTGKEILDYLNQIAVNSVGSGGYPQFTGIAMTISNQQVSNIKIQGQDLEEEKIYRFSIPNYSGMGGDGYPNISNHPNYVVTPERDIDVFKDFLTSSSPIKTQDYQPQGEIVYQ